MKKTKRLMTDRDRISTRQLNRLRRRILRVYGTARREMQEQLTEFLTKYKQLDERKRARLNAGEITEEDYRIWLQNQVFQSDLMRQKLDGITQTCTTAQETAYKLARDEQYNIFSFGANWAFYELEQAAGVTFGLTLYNTEAVKLLLKENPRMVPNKRIKSESNRTYDARVFNRYVMQGIVQGKSVHDIAVQAVNGMADTEIHWAMNNAITALTSAQNAGHHKIGVVDVGFQPHKGALVQVGPPQRHNGKGAVVFALHAFQTAAGCGDGHALVCLLLGCLLHDAADFAFRVLGKAVQLVQDIVHIRVRIQPPEAHTRLQKACFFIVQGCKFGQLENDQMVVVPEAEALSVD